MDHIFDLRGQATCKLESAALPEIWSYAEPRGGQWVLKNTLEEATTEDKAAGGGCGPGATNVIEHAVLMLHR